MFPADQLIGINTSKHLSLSLSLSLSHGFCPSSEEYLPLTLNTAWGRLMPSSSLLFSSEIEREGNLGGRLSERVSERGRERERAHREVILHRSSSLLMHCKGVRIHEPALSLSVFSHWISLSYSKRRRKRVRETGRETQGGRLLAISARGRKGTGNIPIN